jgi:hypothetical protein
MVPWNSSDIGKALYVWWLDSAESDVFDIVEERGGEVGFSDAEVIAVMQGLRWATQEMAAFEVLGDGPQREEILAARDRALTEHWQGDSESLGETIRFLDLCSRRFGALYRDKPDDKEAYHRWSLRFLRDFCELAGREADYVLGVKALSAHVSQLVVLREFISDAIETEAE